MKNIVIFNKENKNIFGIALNIEESSVEKEVINQLDNIAVEMASDEISDSDVAFYGSEEESILVYADFNLDDLKKKAIYVFVEKAEIEEAKIARTDNSLQDSFYNKIVTDDNYFYVK